MQPSAPTARAGQIADGAVAPLFGCAPRSRHRYGGLRLRGCSFEVGAIQRRTAPISARKVHCSCRPGAPRADVRTRPRTGAPRRGCATLTRPGYFPLPLPFVASPSLASLRTFGFAPGVPTSPAPAPADPSALRRHARRRRATREPCVPWQPLAYSRIHRRGDPHSASQKQALLRDRQRMPAGPGVRAMLGTRCCCLPSGLIVRTAPSGRSRFALECAFGDAGSEVRSTAYSAARPPPRARSH